MNNVTLSKKNENKLNRQRNNIGNYSGWAGLIDELFSENVHPAKNSNFNEGLSQPKVNIKESDDSFILEMAVPGYKKSDFQVGIENEELTIAAELKTDKDKKVENYSRREFSYASFKRTFLLPETVEDNGIKASYEDGILLVSIPKKEEAKPKPARAIEIS
ncbi:Hsp20/alpha crystallin family protein [Lutimonas sp.]|uniref:Hsp20/alpha crystallin family protein n=1 Tax=Lutimonas sp. TaxID=1872403 RepID=UPI003D9B4A01